MYYITQNKKKSAAGFTLMEVMVAVTIFTIVVVVGIGALLTINGTYRKAQTDRKAVDSLTYILESMSRQMRTAQTWSTPQGNSSSFSFVDQDGNTIVYQPTSHNGIEMQITTCSSGSSCNTTLTDGTYDITPSGVTIGSGAFPGDGLNFTVFQDGTTGQKYVQINLGGQVMNGRALSSFMFQTSVSKRTFE